VIIPATHRGRISWRGQANANDPTGDWEYATWPLVTMKLDQVGQKLRWQHCRGRPKRYYPARQEDAPGYARTF
jgi:hypothetical protein